MKLSHVTSSKLVGVALLAGLWAIACSSDEGDDNPATGGSTAVSTSTGGKTSTGGASSTKTGGAPGTGGAKTGGAPGTGGTVAAGGTSSTAKTGGSTSTGGANVGGTSTTSTATGGISSTSIGGSGTGTGVGGVGTGGIPSTTTGGTSPIGGNSGIGGNTGDAQTDGGVECDGCIVLFVPLAAENKGTDYEMDFGSTTLADLSDTIVTARVYVETTGNDGSVRLYAKNDTSYKASYSDWTAGSFTTLNAGWHVLTLDLSAAPDSDGGGSDFDKSKVRWLGLNVASGGTFDGAIFTDITVHVDWIKFTPTTAHADLNFDADALDGIAGNRYNFLAGSSLNGVDIVAPPP